MKKICLLTTGGTIACTPGPLGLMPTLSGRELLSYLEGDTSEIECVDLFSMDSSNIQPEEWRLIANMAHACAKESDGILITHGTDTMAYTAAMLSFMLLNPQLPIVLTGAQKPIGAEDSDGPLNLTQALEAVGQLEGGVYICFGGEVIRGCRAVKTRTLSYRAFESINHPTIADFEGGTFRRLVPAQPVRGPFSFFDEIEPSVALVKLIPGALPSTIECLIDCGVKGVVVEAFGLGGVHNFRRDHALSIRKLINHGIPVMLASQCLYEVSTPDLYEVSGSLREAGVISARDMTTEACVTKLMYALGHTHSVEGVRKIMQTDLCGEISE